MLGIIGLMCAATGRDPKRKATAVERLKKRRMHRKLYECLPEKLINRNIQVVRLGLWYHQNKLFSRPIGTRHLCMRWSGESINLLSPECSGLGQINVPLVKKHQTLWTANEFGTNCCLVYINNGDERYLLVSTISNNDVIPTPLKELR